MNLHHGSIIELAVRRKSVSISEISRRMHVNRRSIYNWFQQSSLRIELICEIGYIIGYDFSQDFPDEFDSNGFAILENLVHNSKRGAEESTNSAHFWMTKYITLLERYNDLLLHKDDEGQQAYIE